MRKFRHDIFINTHNNSSRDDSKKINGRQNAEAIRVSAIAGKMLLSVKTKYGGIPRNVVLI